jgi:class 3 adenylate cyclase
LSPPHGPDPLRVSVDRGRRQPFRCTCTSAYTGECTIDEGIASGPPLDLASGIAYRAAAGEALVSRTVRDIVGDAGLPFDDHGVHPIPGMGDWRLFRV